MLKLTQAPQKKFNPYKPLLVMADHPAVSLYVGSWVLTITAFFVGLPLSSDGLVGGAMVAAGVLGCIGLCWAFLATLDWAEDGGWYKVRRNLRNKAEKYERIED